ncbi:MAG: Sensor protein VraS [Cyanobacteriota bacterium]
MKSARLCSADQIDSISASSSTVRVSAFLRSAIRTPLEGANNLASLLGLPVDNKAEWPSFIAESESDKSHPFAELGGSLAGFLAPGAGSVAALRSIPAWGRLAEKAAPSLLRRLPIYAAEGGALGAAYSPEGHRGEGAATGALLGVGASALPTIGKGLGTLKQRISFLRNLDKLKSEGKISEQEYNQAVAEEKALQDLMKKQGLETDIGLMESQIPEYEAKASELAQQIKGKFRRVSLYPQGTLCELSWPLPSSFWWQ